MTGYPSHNPAATAPIPPEPSLFSRKNYVVFVMEGGLFMSGMAFVAQDSILPEIVRQLGGSDAVLAFIPMLTMIGFTLPPLLTAGWIERQGRLMPMLRFFGFLQRLPYLFAALVLLGLGSSHPRVALWSVLACPVLSGVMGGVTLGAWMRVTSRTISGRRRSSGSAFRNLAGAVMGIIAGVMVERILVRFPGVQGYALLHGICFLFLSASYAVFLFTEEPHAEPPPREHHKSFFQQLKWMFRTLHVDPPFRYYIYSRLLNALIFATIPFMAVYAVDVTGRTEAFTGRLLSFQMAGSILGNLAGGWLGDRRGSRKVLLAARCSFFILGCVLLTSRTETMFCMAFLLWGATFSLQQIGEQTYLVEFARNKALPSYFAVASFVQLAAMLGVGLLSGALRNAGVGIPAMVAISLTGVTLSFLILRFKVGDPVVN